MVVQIDSTRLIMFYGAGGNEAVALAGVEDGWHNLSHHGRDEGKIQMLSIIAAGGHFRHGQHLAFDPASPPPLCNLMVSFLQHLSLEVDRFSSATGTLTGLVQSSR